MATLLKAMQTNDSRTENGMATNSTSLNSCVDLFFQIGAMRGQDKTRLINAFTKAFGENPLTAMRLLFWARDVRGGGRRSCQPADGGRDRDPAAQDAECDED